MTIAKAKEVYRALQEKQGNKLVTVMTKEDTAQFWMDDQGIENEIGFYKIVSEALHAGGSLVLRHYSESTEDIYGAVLESQQFIPIPKEQMELAHTTDAKTGERIPKENNVAYCAF